MQTDSSSSSSSRAGYELIVRGREGPRTAGALLKATLGAEENPHSSSMAEKLRRLEVCDKTVVRHASDASKLDGLHRVLAAQWAATIQPAGALDAEDYCCRVVDWCCATCDISEGFTMTLADILAADMPLAGEAIPVRVCVVFCVCLRACVQACVRACVRAAMGGALFFLFSWLRNDLSY